MITFQDWEACVTEEERQNFVHSCINKHRGSEKYRTAKIAREYYHHHNPTIEEYERILYKVTGEPIVDEIGSNHKIKSNFFYIFLTQQMQFLLGNGVTWESGKQPEALGEDFEDKLKKICIEAMIGGDGFGFYNLDHVDVFSTEEYIPLYDEEDGSMKAGFRFWQIDQKKPLRATVYELDGYMKYMWKDGECEILQEKKPYVIKYRGTETDGMEIYSSDNYPGFPIVPLWAQDSKESLLVGNREALDAYDLIKSGFCNDLDEAQEIFWLIQNAGGMDEVDLAKFLQQIRRVKAAVIDEDGAKAEPHTIEVPYQARDVILTRLEADLYRDFMAFDPRTISAGAVTATEIKAGYEPLNSKVDDFEGHVTKWIKGILEVAGIQDNPTYTRSMIVNKDEEVGTVLEAASYLPTEYVVRKILTILGDADQADAVVDTINTEMVAQMNANQGIADEQV